MLTRRRWLASSLALAAAPMTPMAAWARRSGSGLSFPLFDAHLHLKSEDLIHYPHAPLAPPLPSPPPPQPTGEVPEVVRVLRWMDQNGVAAGAAVQHRLTYGFDNRYLLDSTDQYRRRLVPIVVLDAEDPSTPAALPQFVGTHGIAGIRLTGARAADGTFPWLDSAAALHTWEALNAAGLVVDLMTLPPGFSRPAMAAFGRLARQFPRTRLVLDHCAWPDAAGAPDFGLHPEHRALLDCRNVYFKFTTVNLELLRTGGASPKDAMRHFVAVFGADRLMWGSDIGNSAGLYAEMVSRIVDATRGLSRHDRPQLLHDTGAQVLLARGSR